MEYAIRLKGLTKSFQKEKVLKNISWAVLIRLEISNIDRSNYSTEIYNSVLLCKQETGSV